MYVGNALGVERTGAGGGSDQDDCEVWDLCRVSLAGPME